MHCPYTTHTFLDMREVLYQRKKRQRVSSQKARAWLFHSPFGIGNVLDFHWKNFSDLQITCSTLKKCELQHVVNRVFRRRLINHLALENCTKRHKKNFLTLIFFRSAELKCLSIHHLTKTIFEVCYVGQFPSITSDLLLHSKHSIFIAKTWTMMFIHGVWKFNRMSHLKRMNFGLE